MFISEAYAAAGQAGVQGGSLATTLTQLGLILLIFYFFLIRPQQKKIREHATMVEQLKIGDRVLTNGGMYGVVKKLNGMEITLEVSPNVNVVVERMTISALSNQVEKTTTKTTKKNKTVKK